MVIVNAKEELGRLYVDLDGLEPGGDDWSKYGFDTEPSLISKIKTDLDNIIANFDKSKGTFYANNMDYYIFPSLDTSNLYAFSLYSCSNLVDIGSLDLSNCTSISLRGNSKVESYKNIKWSNKITSLYQMFASCSSLKELPDGFNTDNIANMSNTFSYCTYLETIPDINTSKVTQFATCFNSCGNLKNVPVLDFSKATNLNAMFSYCTKLTDTSLDNILVSCTSVTSAYGIRPKTLKELGFIATYYPVSKIESLPHYQDFINAGWTIGY